MDCRGGRRQDLLKVKTRINLVRSRLRLQLYSPGSQPGSLGLDAERGHLNTRHVTVIIRWSVGP